MITINVYIILIRAAFRDLFSIARVHTSDLARRSREDVNFIYPGRWEAELVYPLSEVLNLRW